MEGTRDEGRKGMKSGHWMLWLRGGARTFLQREAPSKISNSFYFKPLGRSAGSESGREREIPQWGGALPRSWNPAHSPVILPPLFQGQRALGSWFLFHPSSGVV